MRIHDLQKAALISEFVFAETADRQITGVFASLDCDKVQLHVDGHHVLLPIKEIRYFYQTTFKRRGNISCNPYQQAILQLNREQILILSKNEYHELSYMGYTPSQILTIQERVAKQDFDLSGQGIFSDLHRDNLYFCAKRLGALDADYRLAEVYYFRALEDPDCRPYLEQIIRALMTTVWEDYRLHGVDREPELLYLKSKYWRHYRNVVTTKSVEQDLNILYRRHDYEGLINEYMRCETLLEQQPGSKTCSPLTRLQYVLALLHTGHDTEAIQHWLRYDLCSQVSVRYTGEWLQLAENCLHLIFLDALPVKISKKRLLEALVTLGETAASKGLYEYSMAIAAIVSSYVDSEGTAVQKASVHSWSFEELAAKPIPDLWKKEDLSSGPANRLRALLAYGAAYPEAVKASPVPFSEFQRIWRQNLELLQDCYVEGFFKSLVNTLETSGSISDLFQDFLRGFTLEKTMEMDAFSTVPFYLLTSLEPDAKVLEFNPRACRSKRRNLYFYCRKMVVDPNNCWKYLPEAATAAQPAFTASETISQWKWSSSLYDIIAAQNSHFDFQTTLYNHYSTLSKSLYDVRFCKLVQLTEKEKADLAYYWKKKALERPKTLLSGIDGKDSAGREIAYLEKKDIWAFLCDYLLQNYRLVKNQNLPDTPELFEYLRLCQECYQQFEDYRYTKFSWNLVREIGMALRDEAEYQAVLRQFFTMYRETLTQKEKGLHCRIIFTLLEDKRYEHAEIFTRYPEAELDLSITTLEQCRQKLMAGETWLLQSMPLLHDAEKENNENKDHFKNSRPALMLWESLIEKWGALSLPVFVERLEFLKQLTKQLVLIYPYLDVSIYDQLIGNRYTAEHDYENMRKHLKETILCSKRENFIYTTQKFARYIHELFASGQYCSEKEMPEFVSILEESGIGKKPEWNQIWTTRFTELDRMYCQNSPYFQDLLMLLTMDYWRQATAIKDFLARNLKEPQVIYDPSVKNYLTSFPPASYLGLILLHNTPEWADYPQAEIFEERYGYIAPPRHFTDRSISDVKSYVIECQTTRLESFLEQAENVVLGEKLLRFLENISGKSASNPIHAILKDPNKYDRCNGDLFFDALSKLDSCYTMDAARQNAKRGNYETALRLYQDLYEKNRTNRELESQNPFSYFNSHSCSNLRRCQLAVSYLNTRGPIELSSFLDAYPEEVILALGYLANEYPDQWKTLGQRLLRAEDNQLFHYVDTCNRLKKQDASSRPYQGRYISKQVTDSLMNLLESDQMKDLRASTYYPVLLYHWYMDCDPDSDKKAQYRAAFEDLHTFEHEYIRLLGTFTEKPRKLYLRWKRVAIACNGCRDRRTVLDTGFSMLPELITPQTYTDAILILLDMISMIRREQEEDFYRQELARKAATIISQSLPHWDDAFLAEYGMHLWHGLKLLTFQNTDWEGAYSPYVAYLISIKDDGLAAEQKLHPGELSAASIQSRSYPEPEELRRLELAQTTREMAHAVRQINANTSYLRLMDIYNSIQLKGNGGSLPDIVETAPELTALCDEFSNGIQLNTIASDFVLEPGTRSTVEQDPRFKSVLNNWVYGDCLRRYILDQIEEGIQDYSPFALCYCSALESLFNLTMKPEFDKTLKGKQYTDFYDGGKVKYFKITENESYMLGNITTFLQFGGKYFQLNGQYLEPYKNPDSFMHILNDIRANIRNKVAHSHDILTKQGYEQLLFYMGCTAVQLPRKRLVIPDAAFHFQAKPKKMP